MVGLAVLPAFQPVDWYFTLTYHPEGAGLAAASTAYESVVIIATAAALITCTGGIGLAGVAALAIMGTPIAME